MHTHRHGVLAVQKEANESVTVARSKEEVGWQSSHSAL